MTCRQSRHSPSVLRWPACPHRRHGPVSAVPVLTSLSPAGTPRSTLRSGRPPAPTAAPQPDPPLPARPATARSDRHPPAHPPQRTGQPTHTNRPPDTTTGQTSTLISQVTQRGHQRGLTRPWRGLPPHVRTVVGIQAECSQLGELLLPTGQPRRGDAFDLFQVRRLDRRSQRIRTVAAVARRVTTCRRLPVRVSGARPAAAVDTGLLPHPVVQPDPPRDPTRGVFSGALFGEPFEEGDQESELAVLGLARYRDAVEPAAQRRIVEHDRWALAFALAYQGGQVRSVRGLV